MRSSLLIMLLSLIFVSCAQKSSQVKLKLSSSFAFGGAELDEFSEGGLMVWGMSADRKSFGKVLNDTDSLTLDLPNGDWTFYAMAWDTTSANQMSASLGAVRCAQSLPIKLDGAPQAPALELKVVNCDSAMFKGSVTGGLSTTLLRLRACESVETVTSDVHECTNNRANLEYQSDKAPVMSVRIRLPDYGNGVNIAPGEGLSRCVPMTNAPNGQWMTPGNGSLVIPSGDPNRPGMVPFRVELEFFYNSLACADPNPSKMVLPHSYVTPHPAKRHFFSGVNEYVLAVAIPDAIVCGNGRDTASPFSGGNGTANFPHLICSEKQLMAIHSNSVNLSKSFRLSADVDLNNLMKGSTPLVDLPPDAECWEMGQNWQPIGTSYSDPSTPITPGPPATGPCLTSSSPFTGNFDGNNHRISNMRMRMESTYGVGFIGTWAPSPEGYLRDLKFNRVEISAGGEIGSLVGYKSNSDQGVVSNIFVSGAEIEVRNNPGDSGGVIGQANNLDLSDIVISNSIIKTQGGSVGGIFGLLSQVRQAEKLHSRVHILPRYAGASYWTVGGIGGMLSTTIGINGEFNSWSHEGVLVANSDIGGLIGNLGNLTNTINPLPVILISNVYANSAITALQLSGSKVGGLFGSSAHEGDFRKGFFAGNIYDKCTGSCERGNIVGHMLSNPPLVEHFRYLASGAVTPMGTSEAVGSHFNRDNSELITEAQLYSDVGSTFTIPPFVHVNGDMPRLVSEKHPCSAPPLVAGGVTNRDSLSFQGNTTNKRGTFNNPIMICRKAQFEQLGSLTGDRHVRILSGINLAGTYTQTSINPGVIVDGRDGFVYGLKIDHTATANNTGIAPLNNNFGVIDNWILANLQLNMVTSAFANTSVNGVVRTNAGIIKNTKVVSGLIRSNVTSSNTSLAGIAHQNSGIIDKVEFRAEMSSKYDVAGLVGTNASTGVIRNSRADGQIYFGGSITNIGGIVFNNQFDAISNRAGLIQRSVVASKINESTFLGTYVGMVAVNNYGDIHDIEISSESRWNFPMNGVEFATVATNNISPGEIRRVVVAGSINNVRTNSAEIGANSGKPVKINTGLVQGVVTLNPSGRVIASKPASSFTCSGSVVTVQNGFPGSSPFQSYSSNPGDLGSYWSGFSTLTNIVWFVAEENGKLSTAKVIGITPATANRIHFTLDRSCGTINFGIANLKIVQDYESDHVSSEINTPSSPRFNGYFYAQDLTSPIPFDNDIWENSFYESTDSDDMEEMISYYSAVIRGEVPPVPQPWEFGEYGMELFNMKD